MSSFEKQTTASQLFAAGQGTAATAKAQTDPTERKRHAKTAFDTMYGALKNYAELIESGITFDTVGTRDIPEKITKALALAQEMCDILTGDASETAAGTAAPTSTDETSLEELMRQMPDVPKERTILPQNMPVVPTTSLYVGRIQKLFRELVRRAYNNDITGNPFTVFVTFLDTLIHTMNEIESVITRQGLINDKTRFISTVKIQPTDTEDQKVKRYNDGIKVMYEILDKIENRPANYVNVDGGRITDQDLIRIFMNIVSGGSEHEQRLKRLQYGNWSQSGGQRRKTVRRRQQKWKTTRKC